MDDAIAALTQQDGWRAEGAAARVHYSGGDDDAQFAIEYYAARSDEGHDDRGSAGRGEEGAIDGEADGDGERRSAGSVLYWTVPADGTTATPVPRASVPTPLRERIRRDLAAADVDPSVESRQL